MDSLRTNMQDVFIVGLSLQ